MPRHPKAADLPALVAKLCDASVEFIIVGGASAVLQGAPITTNDLAHRELRPTAEMLAGRGQINLSTSLGPIDPLCELDAGQGYDELLAHSQLMSDGEHMLRVLDLATLIAVKTKAGRPKDRLVLPILIATLQERDKAKR
jgi:hypothetical protein